MFCSIDSLKRQHNFETDRYTTPVTRYPLRFFITNPPNTQSLNLTALPAPGIAAVIHVMAHLVMFNWRRRRMKPTYSLASLDVPYHEFERKARCCGISATTGAIRTEERGTEKKARLLNFH